MLLNTIVIVLVSTAAVATAKHDKHISDIIDQRLQDIISAQLNQTEAKYNVLLSESSKKIEFLSKRTKKIEEEFQALLSDNINLKERLNGQDRENIALKNSVTALQKQKENLEKQFSMLRNETETINLFHNKMCENRKASKSFARPAEMVSNFSENYQTPSHSTEESAMELMQPKKLETLYNSRKHIEKRTTKLQDIAATNQNAATFAPTAFHAELSRILRDPSDDQRLVFDKVLTNVGNSYVPSTGIFVCPADGIYVFSATILSFPDKFLETEIVLNGNAVAWIYSYNNRQIENSGSNMVVLALQANDAVWVRVHGNNHESGDMAQSQWTTFSGFNLWQNP